ncbi:PA2778 family cysteine peptidase [Marinobacter salexigens]|uniref:PA2778 family cysteine peptidase n=1 Tax=Marinobacter salexigens TaxID=1925763 RepID=UPI000C28404F|nr:PA2778 family cysteine peptidase [Marinobacter salexigens]
MTSVQLSPARLYLVALLGVILSGCASQPKWPANYEATTVTEVPFHPQEQYQCGPASLAMMLNAQDVTATPDELVGKVYLPERKGALQVEMVAAARQYGMLVYPLEPKLNAVLQELKAGNPVLVLQNLRFDWWPQWHFAVAIGYDSQKEALILHSGTEKNYHLPASAFMATWDRSERWARVILPPDQIPATAEPLAFLMAAHDLETTQQSDAAKSAYKAAAKAWPNQPAALLGLGNLAYQQNQWAEAEKYYRTMTERFPDISAGWNNLAEALSRQGKNEESSAMLNKAQKAKEGSKQPGNG